MVEPVSVVLAALGGHFLSQMWDGILGNEAHRLTHVAVRKTLQLIDGDPDEKVNHDIARTVRLAQIAALEAVLDGYSRAHGDAWDNGTPARPAAFLDAAAKFCRDQRRLAKHDPASLPSRVTESLTTTIDGLLDQSPPATLAGATTRDITASIATVAEDEVLRELGEDLHGAVVPADFAGMLRSGRGASAPRFLDIFASHIREAVKSNPRFRDIMLVSGLAEIKARGFEITGILLQIETQLGVDRDELRNSLERLRDTATAIKADTEDLKQGQRRLEQMVMDLAAGGASARHAISKIRALFRPSSPDIDQVPVEQLPRLVRGVIDELAKPGPAPEDFAGAVGRALAEAQTRIGDLAFADAASGLDDALAKAESSLRDDARGLAALLTERGRVSRLQLRYREAAGFFDRAAEAVSFDPAAASAHALTAADALFHQGNEFGDNAALIDAVARYRSTLERTQRGRAPNDWAMTQNNLGNALRTLGARESGTARLEEAVAAFRRAQEERIRNRVPLDWAMTQNNLGNALATLGERE